MAREINLVPDIKDEMIKTLKLRNFIFFLCIVISAASIGVTVFFGIIAGGQQAVISGKQSTINNLSDRMNSYSDLSDFLTIKSQVDNINSLANNKKVLSRTFNILSAIIPNGVDTVQISELNVNLEENTPTISFDAQADAGQEPFIDYNVLDSFKKSMYYMRYDYGTYVDKDNNEIPAYCMIENGSDGARFKDQDKGYYAFWTINAEGCNPANTNSTNDGSDAVGQDKESTNNSVGYTTEDYEGESVVRIWRTPQFNDWYSASNTSSGSFLTLTGVIENIPHFNSSCITYTGHESADYAASPEETVVTRINGVTWTSRNDACKLVPNANIEGSDGISISDSSNGRNASEQLVLRFSATIAFDPAAFSFANQHFMAIPPSGRRNVTDSYVQIQAMFGERAEDCADGDTACINNTTNAGPSSSNSSNNSNDSSTSDNTTKKNGGK